MNVNQKHKKVWTKNTHNYHIIWYRYRYIVYIYLIHTGIVHVSFYWKNARLSNSFYLFFFFCFFAICVHSVRTARPNSWIIRSFNRNGIFFYCFGFIYVHPKMVNTGGKCSWLAMAMIDGIWHLIQHKFEESILFNWEWMILRTCLSAFMPLDMLILLIKLQQ